MGSNEAASGAAAAILFRQEQSWAARIRRAALRCGAVVCIVLTASAVAPLCQAAEGTDGVTTAGTWRTEIIPAQMPAELDKKPAAPVIATFGGAVIAGGSQGATVRAAPSSSETLPASTPENVEGRQRVAASPVLQASGIGTAAERAPELALLLLMILGMTLAVPTYSLAYSFAAGARKLVTAAPRHMAVAELRPQPLPDDDDPAGPCRALVDKATYLWRLAETAVLSLDQGLPLRTLLVSEMTHVGQRLATNAAVGGKNPAALTIGHPEQYWRLLARQLKRCIADLQRIRAVAEASRASFGTQANPEPRMPATREDAYFVLGASNSVDDETVRRLVRALRQCWHPDLARDDKDRQYRDLRIRQINVASDIILEQKKV